MRECSRSQHIDVHFERDLGANAPLEWQDEIDQTIIPGAILDEVVFFHKESKTLFLADTIMNFELGKIRQPYRLIAWLAGIYAPFGGMPIDMRLAFWPRRREVRLAFEKILSWRPERVILSHGRCFEVNGSRAIERAFSWAL